MGRAYGAIADHSDDVEYIELHSSTNFDGTPYTGTATAQLVVNTHSYRLMRSARVDVRVLSVDSTATPPTIDIQWRLREHDKYSQPITANADPTTSFASLVELTDDNKLLPNFGNTEHATGIKVYFKNTAGVAPNHVYSFFVNHQAGGSHKVGEPNTAHQFIECSARGTCDTGSGRCSCFEGFSGDACQRATCPNQCSGHGVCQSLQRFVKDIGEPGIMYENAWDSNNVMSCLCDAGYRGPDCSFTECPSGGDPMGGPNGFGVNDQADMTDARDCSGRGTCDYSSGSCLCYSGYHGERCESQTTFV